MRRIGEVGGKRKLDDWRMDKNSSKASDGVDLKRNHDIQLCSVQTYRETHRQIGSDRVLWGREVRKTYRGEARGDTDSLSGDSVGFAISSWI